MCQHCISESQKEFGQGKLSSLSLAELGLSSLPLTNMISGDKTEVISSKMAPWQQS